MKLNPRQIIGISLLVIAIIALGWFFLNSGGTPSNPTLQAAWQTNFGEPGLIAEALINTPIFEEEGTKAKMVSFSFGAPIVEAALANKVDAAFLGWMPATNLLSKSDEWLVVARLINFKEFIIVKKDSPISTINDLNGKKIGVPFGQGPYPYVIKALEQEGFTIGKDVELVNIQPADLPSALNLNQVDAVAWGGSLYAATVGKGTAKTIASFEDNGLILVSKKFAREHPDQVKRFLQSVRRANFYVSQHKEETFVWLTKDSGLTLEFLQSLPLFEPNYTVQTLNDVNISLSRELVEEIQRRINFAFSRNIISKRVDLSEVVDQNFLH